MSIVYVTQLPHKRDRETGVLTPAFNINTAQEHGQLRIMMPPQAHYQPTEGILRTLRPVLDEYSYGSGDSLLLLGDVAIIAATVAYCTLWHGKFCVLRWDRTLGRYIRVEIDV